MTDEQNLPEVGRTYSRSGIPCMVTNLTKRRYYRVTYVFPAELDKEYHVGLTEWRKGLGQ